jgi:hypothetical protein
MLPMCMRRAADLKFVHKTSASEKALVEKPGLAKAQGTQQAGVEVCY